MNAEDIRNVTFDKVMRGYLRHTFATLALENGMDVKRWRRNWNACRRKKRMRRKKCTSLRKRWTSTAMMKKR